MDFSYQCVACISCMVGKENNIVHKINSLSDVMAIFPLRMKFIWEDKQWKKVTVPLFSGYVFVYFKNIPENFRAITSIEYVYKILQYDDNEYMLVGNDLEFAKFIFSQKGIIRPLEAVQEGDFIRIIDSLLENYCGYVVSVNKRKRIAKISLQLLGNTKMVWLSYDVLRIDVQHEDAAIMPEKINAFL